MFSGIGGFEKGIGNAQESIEGNRQQQADTTLAGSGDSKFPEISEPIKSTLRGNNLNWECAGYSEIDRYASAIYRYHYPNQRNYGDATRLNPEELPDFDCIIGGFPCQSFSIAGKRGGFEDIGGTLFFEICRIARAKRTPYLLLENVKGLLSHDKGLTFETIVGTLDELGYDCQWQVLNSKNHGVPQNRERVFIVGHLRGIPRPKVFSVREDAEGIAKRGNETTNVRCLQGGGHSGGHHSGMTLLDIPIPITMRAFPRIGSYDANRHQQIEVKDDGIVNSLSGVQKDSMVIVHENKSGILTTHGEAQGLRGGASHNYQTLAIANSVDVDGYLRYGQHPRDNNGNPQLLPIGYRRIRRLTPIECERLQGFSDDWTKYGLFEDGKVKEVSDTQRYKCLGNAVTTNVVRDIIQQWG